MAPFVKHEFEPVKNTRSARVAVSNAAALIAALLHCNDKMQDGDDFQRLSNLMYDPNRQLAKAASLLRKNGSDSENDTAVMILEYMVQATNKYYVGVAHAALVRKLRRDGMWDESGWPSELPPAFRARPDSRARSAEILDTSAVPTGGTTISNGNSTRLGVRRRRLARGLMHVNV